MYKRNFFLILLGINFISHTMETDHNLHPTVSRLSSQQQLDKQFFVKRTTFLITTRKGIHNIIPVSSIVQALSILSHQQSICPEFIMLQTIKFDVTRFRQYAKQYDIFEEPLSEADTTFIENIISHFYAINDQEVPTIYREITRELLSKTQRLPQDNTPAYFRIQEYVNRSLMPYVYDTNDILQIITAKWTKVIRNPIDRQEWDTWLENHIDNIKASIIVEDVA